MTVLTAAFKEQSGGLVYPTSRLGVLMGYYTLLAATSVLVPTKLPNIPIGYSGGLPLYPFSGGCSPLSAVPTHSTASLPAQGLDSA